LNEYSSAKGCEVELEFLVNHTGYTQRKHYCTSV